MSSHNQFQLFGRGQFTIGWNCLKWIFRYCKLSPYCKNGHLTIVKSWPNLEVNTMSIELSNNRKPCIKNILTICQLSHDNFRWNSSYILRLTIIKNIEVLILKSIYPNSSYQNIDIENIRLPNHIGLKGSVKRGSLRVEILDSACLFTSGEQFSTLYLCRL